MIERALAEGPEDRSTTVKLGPVGEIEARITIISWAVNRRMELVEEEELLIEERLHAAPF